jgi:hypothetical protein
VAKILGVSPRTVQRYRAAGQINPKTGKPKEARTPSKATTSRVPAKLPRTKPRTGKHKARKADRRVKRNTAARVQGARTLKTKVEDKQRVRVEMRATYDFYDSPGRDARHRTVVFNLTSPETRELAGLMSEEGFDETFAAESAQIVGDFLIKTRGAAYMSQGQVYNIEHIKVI